MEVQKENEVVGYVSGKAIIKNEDGQWFFIEMPEEFITQREQMFEDDLTPLEQLSLEDQNNILKEMVN
jgi:hypothetical protein